MCGIIGIVGRAEAASRLMDGLRRLEYRGYDSAGICTIDDGRLDRRRAEGKLDNLKAENSQKIAAIKEQQKKGTGDAAVLAAQLGTLTNQSKQIDNDQAKVTETVKKRVTNLGFKLVESPESTTPQAIKK